MAAPTWASATWQNPPYQPIFLDDDSLYMKVQLDALQDAILTVAIVACCIFLPIGLLAMILWYAVKRTRDRIGPHTIWAVLAIQNFLLICAFGSLLGTLILVYYTCIQTTTTPIINS
jgi:hypothetical protein